MNQILARNLVWSKHIKFSDLEEAESTAQNLLADFHKDKRIQYCVFSIERGSEQSIEQAHFQGYLEFNKRVDANAFNKIFNFNYFSLRKGTQQQAIDYVKKLRSKLLSKLFQFGQPKNQRFIRTYNNSDPEIPNSIREQETLINQRLKDNYYSDFISIEHDFEHIFIKQSKWLKELWNRYHPVEVIDETPAKTIWIYGPSSSGKTTWTKNFFRSRNITSKQICKKKASNSKRPKLWFELGDEDKNFLWIEEIRENFPDFNDIIQLIDKGTRLEVKGSHVNNNFKLIIFNSLFSPEYVYKTLPKSHQIEILRRLYDGKVYHLFLNKNHSQDYNRIIDVSNNIPDLLLEHFENEINYKNRQLKQPKSLLKRIKSLFSS